MFRERAKIGVLAREILIEILFKGWPFKRGKRFKREVPVWANPGFHREEG